MEGVVGVFTSRIVAERAICELLGSFGSHAIAFLTPEASPAEIAGVPATDAEAPGIGKAISTYVGTAIGAGAGLGLGAAAASLLVPGVGQIFAIGVGAAAVLGAGGAAVGASLGESSEMKLDQGVPRDQVRHYHELLRQGRSLVIVSADSAERAEKARLILRNHGAEPFDFAHKRIDHGEQEAA
jgi:hypothetical protein